MYNKIATPFLGALVNELTKEVFPSASHLNSITTNILESDEHYFLEMIVPGFTKEQVKISIENNILSVKIEQAKSEQKYMKHEFDLHQAQRKFKLPLLIDQSSIEAQLELGILKIKLTKKKDNHYSQEIKID